MRFRRNIERIGELMAYEISKTLDYSTKKVQTPLGVAEANTPDDKIVIATVFRAGLPMHTGFLNIFDKAGNAFVSAYRYYKDKEHRDLDVRIEYIATPDLTNKTVLLVDPMLATGESLELAWKAFTRIKKVFAEQDVTLWCGVIDPDVDEHSYIVPGLGDAGDLAYGEKI